MKYTNEILYIEKIINEVLLLLNEKPLFQNSNFKIYEELHFADWIKVSLIKSNNVALTFELSHGGLRIDIDKAIEIIDLSYENIVTNSEKLKKILMMIFTSTIMVQYCGKYITNLYFIKNDSVETYRYASTLLPMRFSRYCEEKVYLPIFSS